MGVLTTKIGNQIFPQTQFRFFLLEPEHNLYIPVPVNPEREFQLLVPVQEIVFMVRIYQNLFFQNVIAFFNCFFPGYMNGNQKFLKSVPFNWNSVPAG